MSNGHHSSISETDGCPGCQVELSLEMVRPVVPNLGVGAHLGSPDMHTGSQEIADQRYRYFMIRFTEPFS